MKHKQTFEEKIEELFQEYSLIEITMKNDLPKKDEVQFDAYNAAEFQVLLTKGLDNFSIVELRAIR